MDFKQHIRMIPDFPIPGIEFRDITTALKDPQALSSSIQAMKTFLKDIPYDIVIGPESRGFIYGVPLAVASGVGFVPARKPGKLPAKTISKTYDLEYGTNTIEIHQDAIKPGQRIVIADDLLATGGTCKAVCDLVKEAGATVVANVFFIELLELNGRGILEEYGDVFSVVQY